MIRNVFGTDNVRHMDLQSDSFERFWAEHGFRITDSSHKELARPQLHVYFEVALSPRSVGPQQARTDVPTPSAPSTPGAIARGTSARSRSSLPEGRLDLPDVFTPGIDEDAMRGILSQMLGTDQVDTVIQISREAISAVEEGDFARQAELGEELIVVAGELPDFQASGLYFAAEGYRLMADVETDSALQSELRELASEFYEDAIRLSPNTPSAYRGLGRIKELDGDLGEAMRLFEAAHGYALAGFAAGSTLPKAPGLAHEILRTSRHRLHCIMGMRESTPGGKWTSEVNEAEIRGDIAKADRYHQELLQLFSTHPKWMYIECFMAMVFLARAWGAIGNIAQAELYFMEALHARLRLLAGRDELNSVEKSNLRWWCNSVIATHGLSSLIHHQAEQLSDMLDATPSASNILSLITEITKPIAAAGRIRPQ